MRTSDDRKRTALNLGCIGLLLSVAYLVMLVASICIATKKEWIDWKPLEINQIGDFWPEHLVHLLCFGSYLDFFNKERSFVLA